jgi:hypothetical protein
MKRCPIVALWFAVLVAPLISATLERLSLDDMIAKSTVIVRGRVANAHTAFSGNVIYTHYSIQVLEGLKGPSQGLVDVVVPGGTANGLQQNFAGAPEFQLGGEYVFFLWTSKSGLTQVMGLTQGFFSVAKDSSSDPAATRAASHELMLAPGTGIPVKDETLVMRLSELRSRISAAGSGSRAK